MGTLDQSEATNLRAAREAQAVELSSSELEVLQQDARSRQETAERPLVRAVPKPSEGPAGMRLIIVNRDGSDGASVPLESPMEIGTGNVGLRIAADGFVSRRHARIVPCDGGARITDLGSVNGVFVRLARATPVFPGDIFLVGHQLLRLDAIDVEALFPQDKSANVRVFGTPTEGVWGKVSVIAVGGKPLDSFFLRTNQIVIGRESGDAVFSHDAFLSRRHAQLRTDVRDGTMRVMLEDLASANGTYLKMRGEAKLTRGDMIRVGDQLLKIGTGRPTLPVGQLPK